MRPKANVTDGSHRVTGSHNALNLNGAYLISDTGTMEDSSPHYAPDIVLKVTSDM
jgi:hypothetical protein